MKQKYFTELLVNRLLTSCQSDLGRRIIILLNLVFDRLLFINALNRFFMN